MSWLLLIAEVYVLLFLVDRALNRARYHTDRQQWERDHPGLKWEDWRDVHRR